jgi:hypothetical protein
VLLEDVNSHKEYEFLIGTGPGQYDMIQRMRPGQEIRLGRIDGGLTLDEVPIQRLYRKTMEGIVEIADSAWHLLVKRRPRATVSSEQ